MLENREQQLSEDTWTGLSSALFREFGDQAFDVGVTELHGCTAVIVSSTAGIWVGHFWEVPAFMDNAIFEREVLGYIVEGDGPAMPGLRQYTQPGGAFGPGKQVAIAIVTPQRRDFPAPGNYEYRNKVLRLSGVLSRLFAGRLIHNSPVIHSYGLFATDMQMWNNPEGKVLVQYDPTQPAYRVWHGTTKIVAELWH